MNMICELQRG